MKSKKPTRREYVIWSAVPAVIMAIFIAGVVIYNSYFAPKPDLPHATISIQHAEGGASVSLNVELAVTSQQRGYGLMFRRSLAPNTGMLFLWDADQPATFWMKNTYIPLDMLFVRHDGTIAKIVVHAKPFDLSYISSDEPVRGVIEIGGDEAQRLDIRPGDKVLYSAFSDK